MRFLLVLLLSAIGYNDGQVVLTSCKNPVVYSPCDLTCTTPDQSSTEVKFVKPPDLFTVIGQCLSNGFCTTTAAYTISRTTSRTTVLTVLNYTCVESVMWRCDYNSDHDTYDLPCVEFPVTATTTDISDNAVVNASIVITVNLGCLVSQGTVEVKLDYKDSGGTIVDSSSLAPCSNVSLCADPLYSSYECQVNLLKESSVQCETKYSIEANVKVADAERTESIHLLSDVEFTCPTLTTEMSSTSTSQDQTTSSKNPSVDSFPNTEKTETTNMTTTDSDLTSASLHVSSEVTTSIQTESDTGTGQDQTSSSQNPPNAPFHNTQKAETTFMTTTDSDLTSSSLHVSSEVTTPIKTKSDNITDLGVSAIIAIAIAGFVFLSLIIIILIICCCQYYRKKSKKKTSEHGEHGEEFQEIHDDVVPKFWPNFNSHRYGLNEINGSTIHLTRGYNLYQGEHNRGYNFRPKHQSDNYNRSGSDRKIITENRKHKQKQVQEKISHGFPQSIPDDIMNRHDHDDINGINTYNLHDNNQNLRTYHRGHAVSSPRRFEYQESFLPHEYIKHNRKSSPYMTYFQEHVPRNLEGLTFYQGYNGATNKRSRRYY